MRLINAEEIEWYGCTSEDECPYPDRECKDCSRGKSDQCQVMSLPTIHAVPIEVLQEIKREIEGNMESIIGKYDSSTPTRNMPSAKIERNEGRKECLAIIDKHLEQYKEDAE